MRNGRSMVGQHGSVLDGLKKHETRSADALVREFFPKYLEHADEGVRAPFLNAPRECI